MNGNVRTSLLPFALGLATGISAILFYNYRANDCKRAYLVDQYRRAKEKRCRAERRSVRLLLIRHGKSESNKDRANLHNGRHIHVPLCNEGKKQARALGRRLARCRVRIDEAYSSEALRAQQTAEIALKEMSSDTHITIVPTQGNPPMGLCEIAMGDWTGKDKREVNSPAIKRAREADAWEWKPPGLSQDESLPGESYRDVEERFLRFLENHILPKRKDESGIVTVAVFSHHAAIRCVLRPLLQASPRMLAGNLSPKNTSITELIYDSTTSGRKGGWRLVRINDFSHLEPAEE